jgi:hypothetical protein
LEDELRRTGKLPAGVSLDTPRVYRDVAGEGTLVLASNGLPPQLNIAIDFPQQSNGSRVQATIHSNFSHFATGNLASGSAGGPLAGLVAGLRQVDWPAAGQLALLMSLGLALAVLVLVARQPKVYTAFSLAVVLTLLVGPLAQTSQVYAFSQDQAAAQQAQIAQQLRQQQRAATKAQLRAAAEAVANAPAAAQAALGAVAQPQTLSGLPNAPSLAAASVVTDPDKIDSNSDGVPDIAEPAACLVETGLAADCDKDPLTNLQEYRLGTLPDNPDSDGDGLRDDLEVKGFALANNLGHQWYSNPNGVDSSVLGQINFTSNLSATTATGLWQPRGAAYDPAANILWVSDTLNNRVLLYQPCSAITVTSAADSGFGSLRQSLANVCAGGVITFSSALSGQTIYLSSTLTLSTSVTIDGSALAAAVTLSGDSDNNGTSDVRVLYVNAGITATLKGLIITTGAAAIGAGIEDLGTLTINSTTLLSSTASSYGGGLDIVAGGVVTVTNSTFAGNTAPTGFGGGLHNDGLATVQNSTFNQNSVGLLNGGTKILNLCNTVLGNSTFYDCLNYGTVATHKNNLIGQTGTAPAAW